MIINLLSCVELSAMTPAATNEEATRLWQTIGELAGQTSDQAVNQRVHSLVRVLISVDVISDDQRLKAAELLKV